MRHYSGRTGLSIIAGNRISPICTTTPWFSSGHQILVVYITQDRGYPEANALADFDIRDVTAAHPDFDCALADSKVLGNLPFRHQAVFKGDHLGTRRWRGQRVSLKTNLYLAGAAAKFMSAEHTLNRTAADQSSRTSSRQEPSRYRSGTASEPQRNRQRGVVPLRAARAT